ncbi:unnamed protein product [Rangifer tarandus platyrhynchus]|uniref:Uncharacterized protein n=1 Tax=Rangifer tarandus platyrhynchus TaxID=3082113 RepID=A0ABN8YR98_RANTA|nr:unnamed protein product [Rangifer tarandus platyrhynchus]
MPLRQQEDLEPSTAEHRALVLTFKYNQAPLPRCVPTEVVATHMCRTQGSTHRRSRPEPFPKDTRESLPWLLPKTQTPTMTDPPLQGERAPVLDRDPEPVPETPGPGEPWALQRRSLSAPRGCHHLAPHPGEIQFTSPEILVICTSPREGSEHHPLPVRPSAGSR